MPIAFRSAFGGDIMDSYYEVGVAAFDFLYLGHLDHRYLSAGASGDGSEIGSWELGVEELLLSLLFELYWLL